MSRELPIAGRRKNHGAFIEPSYFVNRPGSLTIPSGPGQEKRIEQKNIDVMGKTSCKNQDTLGSRNRDTGNEKRKRDARAACVIINITAYPKQPQA